jgi:hypothetical protein
VLVELLLETIAWGASARCSRSRFSARQKPVAARPPTS